jgi:NADPH2:quinone reductase
MTRWAATWPSRRFARLPGAAATWWWGFAGGSIPALPLNLTLLKGASIVGVFRGGFARNEPKANASAMTELAQWYAQGKIKPAIDRTLSMAELKQAYARMGSRGVMGKLVMPN